MQEQFNYPAMLDLTGRRCVVIGGGAVAARKLRSLCAAGAQVTVVAPDFGPELRRSAEPFGKSCRLLQQGYAPEQLAGAFIVVAATDSFALNRQITAAAPLLCNNVTEPQLGNFSVPASLKRGRLTLALASGGMPAYTRFLKAYLERRLTEDFAAFGEFLLELRSEVQRLLPTPQARQEFWRAALDEDVLALLEAGRLDRAKEKIRNAVNSHRS